MNASKTRKNLSTIAIIAIILLLLINGFLLYDRASKDQELKQQEKDLTEVRQLQSELEKEYYEALAELDDMRGDNEELNAMIDAQKEELTRQRNRISNLIYENRNLEEARKELQLLREQVDEYIVKIDELTEENLALLSDKERLEKEKEILTEEITTERQATDELMAIQSSMVKEREMMEDELRSISKKVDKASVIDVANIEVDGYRVTDGGRERRRRSARNVDMLRVCFETTANDLVEFGDETFFIRIVSPAGETMAIESLGSGVIEDFSTNTQVRFTQMQTVTYDQEPQTVCSTWAPEVNFTSGNYTVEVYNKGFLAGTAKFELR